MNLITKIKRAYVYKFKWNQCLKKSLREFKEFPLTDGDKYAITLILLAALLLTLWHYKHKIDSELIHTQQKVFKTALEANKMRQLVKLHADMAFKNEAIIVSMMNGLVLENGRIVTYCRRNAAGDCNAP